MPKIIVILSDQLAHSLPCLELASKSADIILMCELHEETTYIKHHVKKIAFWFASMRHFAHELRDDGFSVEYVELDNPQNTQRLETEIQRIAKHHNISEILITEPSEWRLREKLKLMTGVNLTILEDTRFLCTTREFEAWANTRKQLRMENFYHEMRKKYRILMNDDGTPIGGKWNYDKENRNPASGSLRSPKRISHKKDQITLAVLKLVSTHFKDHFGTLEPFHFALNRKQALIEAEHFIEKLLPHFGHYQDVMVKDEAYLYHSLLSTYINAGLLLPLELCQMAERAYKENKVPLNAAEGYIRQILGWREYVRGVYWHFMPTYKALNYFSAKESLPDFYWTANTKMTCCRQAIETTRDHAYAHHIERLMVTGNFALLAGINPNEVCEWYHIVYADAYDWVELPNTLGMALYGDGGLMASKPYAASAKYINKMSNFCKECYYDPNLIEGERACPFNALYWDFIDRNDSKLRANSRMALTYVTYDKMSSEKKNLIKKQSSIIFGKLRENKL